MFTLADVLSGVQPDGRQAADSALARQIVLSEAAIDSRLVVPESLFVALAGERVDGHAFVAAAAARGARAALVRSDAIADLTIDRPVTRIDSLTGAGIDGLTADSFVLVTVDAPLDALHRLAAFHRAKFRPLVVGITGSVGKTSTKEVTAAVLSRKYRTLKNPKSYNSEATLPIVLLQLTEDHEVAVLEMGMHGQGEIAQLANLARPLHGIVTNVGPSHLERLGSMDAIQRAKSELVQALPAEGRAILNFDDERVRAMASATQATPFFYGLDPAADLWADEIESRGMQGIAFRAHHAGESVTLKLPLIGRHSVHTALAATAAGLILGLGWDAIVDGLRDESAQLRLITVRGIRDTMLIDDTYNASPASSLAALNLLDELDGRKIVVHGDMLELGELEEESHRRVGARASDVAAAIVAVGERARWIAEEAEESGMPPQHIYRCTSNREAIDILRSLLAPGDVVLIKGSRGMAMEQIVSALQPTI